MKTPFSKPWKVALCAITLLVAGVSFAAAATIENESTKYGLPSIAHGPDALVVHSIYSVMYDNDKNNPVWVSEYLTKEDVDSEAVSRDDFDFADDPAIVGEAKNSDYIGSGYDRGHMAPAEDMELNTTLMQECFYMTNMAPQKHSLNGGRWKSMEEIARKVAVKEGEAWIVSGPVYETASPDVCSGTFGKSQKVVVPQAFFKIIFYVDGGNDKAIAFLIPHLKGKSSDYQKLEAYLVPIDTIEQKTGLNFLDRLDDSVENPLEAAAATKQDLADLSE